MTGSMKTYLALALRSECCEARVIIQEERVICLACLEKCSTHQMCSDCLDKNKLCEAGDFLLLYSK